MTEDRKMEEKVIEDLLGTRQQLTEWLQKIGAAGEGVPGSVRDRVRADYEGRLAEVVYELRSHSEALRGTVNSLRAALNEQDRIRLLEEETIAEVELRFHVGEFSEAEWTSRREASRKKLNDALESIGHLTADITRFEEVLSQIRQDSGREERASSESPSPEEAVVAGGEGREMRQGAVDQVRAAEEPSETLALHREEALPQASVAEPVEAPRFIPKGTDSVSPRPANAGVATSSHGSAGAPGDDLAFLKAMTIDPSRSTAAPRAGERAERAGSATIAKSLKCGECSAMNRPTEWYCERCGAELAAL